MYSFPPNLIKKHTDDFEEIQISALILIKELPQILSSTKGNFNSHFFNYFKSLHFSTIITNRKTHKF